MKKISITILAFLYLAVSSGIAMNIHQCMGKIYSVGLFDNNDKCGKCGMKSGNGCCSDQFKMVKINDSHLASSGDVPISCPITILEHPLPFKPFVFFYTTLVPDRFDHSPPGYAAESLCVLNCVFRI